MKARLTSFALALALLGALLMLPGSSVAQTLPFTNPVALPALPNACTLNGASGTFTGGLLDITSFAVQNRQLMALGNLSGTCTTATGSTTLTNEPVAIPITIAQATCAILDLTLGPIHLDLLGLVVDLSSVHLTINAEPGPGNLLGNLLCAIAHLLDNPGNPLGGLAALLNGILRILG